MHAPKVLSIRSRREGTHSVRVEVCDQGIGLRDPENVFKPFFTTKEVGKGTGQGLAISYDVIVKKHGGTLEVESEPGKGTTMVVTLPTGGLT